MTDMTGKIKLTEGKNYQLNMLNFMILLKKIIHIYI